MVLYVIVFFITTLIGILIDACNHNRIRLHGNRRFIRILYTLLLAIFVIFVGCRDVSVGSDSISYLYKFENAKDYSLNGYLMLNLLDPSFYTFTWLMQRILNDVNLYFIVMSLFFFATYLLFISKFSSSVAWSIWIFNSLGFTTFAMSSLRQSLAMAFCIIAYFLYVERKKTSWIMMLLAASFHISAIIYIPMMFVSFFAHDKRPWKLVIVICAIFITAPFLMEIIMMVDIKDGRYSETSEVGGVGMILLLAILVVLGLVTYFPRKKNLPITYYYEFIAIGFALCSFVVSRFDMAAMRLFWYFLSFAIVFIPNVINSMKNPYKIISAVSIGLVTTYYLFYRVMSDPYENSRMLLPYKLFWQ